MIGSDPRIDKEIEIAIKFLVHSIESTRERNEKPVIMHSIRVGLYLYDKGYDKTIVVAGILHDLLEDSDTSLKEIEKNFGKDIAELVQANSFDKDIPEKTAEDKKKRYSQVLERGLAAGKKALIIKAADILDNSYYYYLASDRNLHKWLLEKMRDFIKHTSPIIKEESVWNDINEQYNNLIKK
jgi:(p)ppGpp synthase/HD superfamily hydrolase